MMQFCNRAKKVIHNDIPFDSFSYIRFDGYNLSNYN